MAFQSKDGKKFTNKPAARSHDAHTVARLTAPADRHETREQDIIKEMAGMHGMAVQCPACGHQFDPDSGSTDADLGTPVQDEDAANANRSS